jgi:hypothetical protein
MPGAVAIFSEDEVPPDMENFIQLNVELAEIWPNITESKDPLPDAEEWDGKRQDRRPGTLTASRPSKRPLAGLFAFLRAGLLLFCRQKKGAV